MTGQILIDRATESIVLHAADPLLMRDLLPRSRTLAHPQWNFAVHHTIESTRVLRNMGFEVAAPIRYQYDCRGVSSLTTTRSRWPTSSP